MTQPFNTPELNKGFQMDTSLLTPEQLEHVLQIFQARGIKWRGGKEPHEAVGGFPHRWHRLNFNVDGDNTLSCSDGTCGSWKKAVDQPLIDYPTLCRGAVQLEPLTYAEFPNNKARTKLFEYAKSIGVSGGHCQENTVYLTSERDCTVWAFYKQSGGLVNRREIYPDDFEAKLRGIYPTNAENAKVETVEKPRYLKSNTGNNLIVKWERDSAEKMYFAGHVVDKGITSYRIGAVSENWYYPTFEPCDYAPAFEFVKGEDSPATEQPNPIEEAEEFYQRASPAFDKLLDFAKKMVARIAELEADNEGNNELIASLNSEVERLKQEAQLGQNAEPKEPLYDGSWLAKIIKDYYPHYNFMRHECGIYTERNNEDVDLDPKTSATIILAALAKHLNGGKIGKEMIVLNEGEADVDEACEGLSFCVPLFVDAQKAISILTASFPEVLKNYLV